MKSKEIFRLAKLSLASRKQSAKSTQRGIAFGMILLVPVLFIAIGLYGGLSAQVNKHPHTLYAKAEYIAARSQKTEVVQSQDNYQPLPGSERVAKLEKTNSSDYQINYEMLGLTGNYADAQNLTTQTGNNVDTTEAFRIIDDAGNAVKLYYKQTDNYNYGFDNRNYYPHTTGAVIIDDDYIDDFVPEKTAKQFDNNVMLPGYDKGFKDGGKGQVVVSEFFLEVLGVTPSQAYGKKISLMYNDTADWNMAYDSDADPADNSFNDRSSSGSKLVSSREAYLFYQYEVVGVVDKQVTDYARKMYGSSNNGGDGFANYMSSLFFLSSASFDMGDGEYLAPEFTVMEPPDDEGSEGNGYKEQAWILATLPYSEGEFSSLNEEYGYVGISNFSSLKSDSSGGSTTLPYWSKTLFLDTATYAQLDKVIGQITATIGSIYSEPSKMQMGYKYGSNVYGQMYIVFMVTSYMVMFMSIMGGIIFFAAMVNLFNSVVHSVDSRKHYLAVMRAIGAKDNVIPKLYIAEALTMFRRALVWVVIFGSAICVGIKLLTDQLFGYVNESGLFGSVKLGVGYGYIPVALGVGIAVLIALGFLFSVGVSRKVAKRPIMTILGDA